MIELREVRQRGLRPKVLGVTATTVEHFGDFAMQRIPLLNRLVDFPMTIQAERTHPFIAARGCMTRGTVVCQLSV